MVSIMEYSLVEQSRITCFLEALSYIADSRDNRGKRHSLVFIIVAVILAIISGRSKTSSIHRFIENRIIWLRNITQIEDAQPISRAHLPRLLDGINWTSLDQLITQHFKQYLSPSSSEQDWLAIDGKVLRGTVRSGEQQAIIHVTGHESRTEVAQAQQSGTKSSEIPVVRKLLKEHGLEKHKISLDAHHCNPETTRQIALAKGIYLTQVKENQPILLAQCQALSQTGAALFKSEDHEKAHGRLTSRYAAVYSLESVSLDKRWNESKLQTLIVIKRKTQDIKKDKSSEAKSYYISNQVITPTCSVGATELAHAIRKHWGVESNNWILDVTFNEDKVETKASNQSYILGRLRGFALQLFRKAKIKNFQAAIEKFCDSTDEMEAMLRQVNFL
jgi:predicted transposase YbfD/YdcC